LIGSKEGIMHIAMSFLSDGDEVLVPNPGYPSYKVTTELAGASPRFYNLTEDNGWRPDLNAMAQEDLSKVKIMWINYPNMPTGARVDLDFYHSLVDFAIEHKILICHDNPYNYILNDNPLSIFSVPRAKECAIELFSLSKCYNMAGWRVGALIGAKEYVDVVMRFKSNMDSGMYKAVQLAAVKALAMEQDWFDQLNVEYRERRKLVWQIFDLLDCRYDRNTSGLFVWAKVPEYITDVESWVDQILYDARVFITPGFIFGSNGERYVRIALCSSQAILKNAFEKIDQHFIKSIA
jgi:aspartate/methionine/tyrosine aminotransferase